MTGACPTMFPTFTFAIRATSYMYMTMHSWAARHHGTVSRASREGRYRMVTPVTQEPEVGGWVKGYGRECLGVG